MDQKTEETMQSKGVYKNTTKEDTPETTESKNYTLDHSPTLSEDLELFSHEHEHDFEQEKKRKRNAIVGYGFGVTAFFMLGVVGFFSGNPPSGVYKASMFDIEKIDSYTQCIEKAELDAENKEENIAQCNEKFHVL